MRCLPRYSTPRTPDRPTLGTKAAELAELLGTPLMDWQQAVLDTALELVEGVNPATGEVQYRFAYNRVILTVPRQSGKTTLMLVLMLTRALSENANIRFAMQTYTEAQGKLVDEWLPELDHTPIGALYKPRFTNGEHGLRFPETGSVIKIMASTKTAGHGTSKLKLAILDEAFSQPDARFEQALSPATSTSGGRAQLWFVSTAGPMDGTAEWFREQCETGRMMAQTKQTQGTAYFEWSAADDADPLDPQTWRDCMPALGITQEESFIAGEAESMELSEFKRAYLNQWTTQTHDPIIPLDAWAALGIDETPDIDGAVSLSFDVTNDASWSSIAGASALGNFTHLDLIAHERGTDWLPEALSGLLSRHEVSAVVYDPSSAAGAVAERITDPKVKSKLIAASTRDFGAACQMITTSVTEKTIAHGNSPDVLAAIEGAAKRTFGDLWRWSRSSPLTDISPLVSMTLALWGMTTQKPSAVSVQFVEIGNPMAGPQPMPEGEVISENPFYSVRRMFPD